MIALGLGQVILGGKVYNSYQSELYHVTCSEHYFTITKLNQEMSVPRKQFVAIPIPDATSGCMSEGKVSYDRPGLVKGVCSM